MRFTHSLASLVFLVCAVRLPAATPADPAALVAAIDTALVARDLPALRSLVHVDGMSADDIAALEPTLARLMPEAGTATVSHDRLPDTIDIGKHRIDQGRRIELTRAPAGIIRVSIPEGRARVVSTIPYVQVTEGCLLAGIKRIDLGWKGPPDRQLGFAFAEDYPKGPVKVTIRYNVSGVDQEQVYSSYSGAFFGQHIDELTVSGLADNFRGRLVLRDGGKEFFRSAPITGQSSFTYRRSAP